MTIRPFLIFLLVSWSFLLCAQKTISGTITDSTNGDPLIGASILVSEGTGGTITDIDGSFSLDVPAGVEQVEISYTGYQTQVVNVSDLSTLSLSLTPGEVLEEVVVIGYGTIKREDATGSIQSVSSESFNRGALTGPQELLSGKVAGVSITTSGDPGGGSRIRIRGESSINASNDPLIVIDGVPLASNNIAGNRNPFDVINPNDVESFTVLKDASAAAIYGNRAAGGVILITTKKGKSSDKLSIGYNGNVSFGQISNKVDVLNAAEFRAAVEEHFGTDHPAYENLGDADTDWQDEIYETAVGHEHNVNLSGGLAKLPYRLSLGFLDKNGVLKGDNYNRQTIGLNINPGFLDNTLQVNLGLKSIWSSNRFADRGAIGNANGFDPTQTPLDASSPFGGFTTWINAVGNPEFLAPTNPLALLELREDISDVNRIVANASADYRLPFLPALRANLNIATDQSNSSGTVMIPTFASFSFDPLNGGGRSENYSQSRSNDLLEFFLNYEKDFSKHSLDILGGYSWQKFGFENEFFRSNVAGTASETTQGNDSYELFLISLFGRVNYSFNDRYLLTVSLRNDGTSRFSPENRWGLFPAAAFAAKLLENDNNTFNSLKLRLGAGVTGQENLGEGDISNFYAYQPQYTQGFENASYQFGQEFIFTQRPEGYDTNIKWEETATYNIGLDFSIVRDRLSGSLDLYQRNTKDLLNRIPVPAGTNLTNFITTNVGNLENQGVELSLFLTPVQTEKLSWDLAFNVAHNRNEITKLTASDDPNFEGVLTGGVAGGVGSTVQIHSVGHAPRSFFLQEQAYDEAGNILEGQFVDRNGDGIDNDFYRGENPAADFTYGLTSNFNYGNFGFSIGARALTGNFVYNNVQTDIGFINRLVNSSNVLQNVHSSALELGVFNQGSLTFSDHFIEDASFLRVDHLTLSYGLQDLIGYGLGLTFTVQNPLVLTPYSGLDPETDIGIDNNLYPRPRTYVFGLSAKF